MERSTGTGTAASSAHSDRVLEAFAQVARPPMVKAWGRNCCINATRATILALRHFGVNAEPFPCKLCVEDRAINVAKLVGFTREERAGINAKNTPACVLDRSVPGEGWEGHVAVVVERRVLLDPSFDQATEPDLGLDIPEHMLMIPVPASFADGGQEIRMEGTIDDGPLLRIRYWPSGDMSFKTQEAWTGVDSRIMAAHVALLIQDALQQGGTQAPT